MRRIAYTRVCYTEQSIAQTMRDRRRTIRPNSTDTCPSDISREADKTPESVGIIDRDALIMRVFASTNSERMNELKNGDAFG